MARYPAQRVPKSVLSVVIVDAESDAVAEPYDFFHAVADADAVSNADAEPFHHAVCVAVCVYVPFCDADA
jgi:hypothetical protein